MSSAQSTSENNQVISTLERGRPVLYKHNIHYLMTKHANNMCGLALISLNMAQTF